MTMPGKSFTWQISHQCIYLIKANKSEPLEVRSRGSLLWITKLRLVAKNLNKNNNKNKISPFDICSNKRPNCDDTIWHRCYSTITGHHKPSPASIKSTTRIPCLLWAPARFLQDLLFVKNTKGMFYFFCFFFMVLIMVSFHVHQPKLSAKPGLFAFYRKLIFLTSC